MSRTVPRSAAGEDLGRATLPALVEALTAAVCTVFETMVFRSLTPQETLLDDGGRPYADVVGTVGFAGPVSGLVTVLAGRDAARAVAGAMLSTDAANVGSDLADAVGELTNMVTGLFRTKLADDGRPWAISVPTVVVGTDLRTTYLTAGRRVLQRFCMDDHDVFVELIVADTTPPDPCHEPDRTDSGAGR